MTFGPTTQSNAVIGTLCFMRFWLGVGVGGDYPLSATIMSEYSNKANRGGALVFSSALSF
jgi:PHS family inorganic phosphate transporter-like MFS transporter